MDRKQNEIVPNDVLLQRLKQVEQELAQVKARLAVLESQQPEKVAQPMADKPVAAASSSLATDFRQPETPAVATATPPSHAMPTIAKVDTPPADFADNELTLPEAQWEDLTPPHAAETEQPVFRQPEKATQAETGKRKVVLKRSAKRKEDKADVEASAWEDNPLFAWFVRANPLLKVGAVVLFFGLAFLLRYVGGAIPLVGRYALVFAAGAAAVGVGARLRKHKREYGLTVQGLGFGLMYLTVLAAVKLHPLLPNSVAFVAMVVLVGLMALNALRHDAKIMAQAAVLGGLAAPVLASDGSGAYLILFTYLALLNGGIAVLAWFKTWRSLNLLGMLGTFFIAAAWGARDYSSDLFATTEPFLLYHWLLYTAIACFFARKTLQQQPFSGSLKYIPDNASLKRIWHTVMAYGAHIGALDSSLLFGSALLSFGLQYEMVHTFSNGATSALLWAVVYGGLALYFARLSADFAVMKQAFAVLALVFVTLAIPLELEQQWTAMAWALEAALIYVFGLTQRQPQMRVLAMVLFVLAALAHLDSLSWSWYGADTLLQGSAMGTLLSAASGGVIYFAWVKMRQEGSALWEMRLANLTLFLALVHAMTLPMLVFGKVGCLVAFAVYALAFSLAQSRQAQWLLSGFTLLSVLLSAISGWGAMATYFYVYAMVAAALWLVAATLLHQSSWLPEKINGFASWLNQVGGWIVIALGFWFGYDALHTHLSVHYSNLWHTAWLWSWMVWHGVLLFWAYFSGWRQGMQAASWLAVLFAIGAALWHTPNWAESMLGQAFVFMVIINVFAALGLWWQPEKHSGKNTSSRWIIWSHTAILLLYVAMWARFLGNVAELHTPAIAPWGWLGIPFAAWLVLTQQQSRFNNEYRVAYWHIGSTVMAMMAMCWLVYANFAAPPRSSLPYLPVLNVVELGSVAVLWQAYRWLQTWQPENDNQQIVHRLFSGSLPVLFLLLLSGGVMRLWHVFADVPWRLNSLLASFGVQASLSIVWALAAIALMVTGNRAKQRPRWLAGASIMGVVVLKLFLVELGNSGGVARIVSFIVVGLLMLLVGWFAPAPPREE